MIAMEYSSKTESEAATGKSSDSGTHAGPQAETVHAYLESSPTACSAHYLNL